MAVTFSILLRSLSLNSKQLKMTVNQIEYNKLREFEDKIGGNVKVGGYKMDEICPVAEGLCYQIKLEESDTGRLFLLGEATFTHLTPTKDYLLTNISDDVKEMKRVKYWIDQKLDLRESPEWSPIFVAKDIESPIVTIDGNHRLMAHFNQHRTIEGLHGYLFIHQNIQKWGCIPKGAK
jgi:hypothetical protein